MHLLSFLVVVLEVTPPSLPRKNCQSFDTHLPCQCQSILKYTLSPGITFCSYYSMEIEYFMSSLASDVMGILTENFLWMRTLGSTPILESEVQFPMLIFC